MAPTNKEILAIMKISLVMKDSSEQWGEQEVGLLTEYPKWEEEPGE